jgi:hypothetical protein
LFPQQAFRSIRAPATGAPLQSVTSTTVVPGEQSARSPTAPSPIASKSKTVETTRMNDLHNSSNRNLISKNLASYL